VGRDERKALIKELENLTNSRVLVLFLGDRRGLETKIASDIIPLMFKHLSNFHETEKINLFLYTTGGVTISGYSIVNLIREYCKEFGVIIPFKALSTGTLMALGANTIVMSKMGQLGPVDPSVNHPLAPRARNPANPSQELLVPVNVEDVLSYFELAKKEAQTNSEKELNEVLRSLSNGVHPIVLGAVNRARDQIKFLTKTLLQSHMDDNKKIDEIVKTLLEQRFSHDYLVGRTEAKNILKLNIIDVSQEINDATLKLYDEFSDLMELNNIYIPEEVLGRNETVDATFFRGAVESSDLTHLYTTVRRIQRVQIQQQGVAVTRYSETPLEEGWVKNDDD